MTASTSTQQTGWLFPLVKDLVDQIFVGESRRLSATVTGLIAENHKLGGAGDWFQYQGRLFRNDEITHHVAGQQGRLHTSLFASVDEHMKDLNQIELDKRWVHQALVILLRDCSSLQDIVDALPNSLHSALAACREGAKTLKRSREEAWSLQDNPRALSQYNKLRDKMEFYNIARLVY